jgi:hypothetical protein
MTINMYKHTYIYDFKSIHVLYLVFYVIHVSFEKFQSNILVNTTLFLFWMCFFSPKSLKVML